MITLIRSTEFDHWLKKLRDARAKARIAARLISAQHGISAIAKPSAQA